MKCFKGQQDSVIYFIVKTISPFYWQLSGVILVACYWAIHISASPYIIKLILDQISLNPSISDVIMPVVFYILLSLIFNLNFRFYDYVSLRFYPQLKLNIIAQANEKVSQNSYSFFQNQLSGSLANRIKDLSNGTAEIVQILTDRFFSNLLALLIGCFTLMRIHVALSVILIIGTFLFIATSFLVTKKARLLSQKFSETNSFVMGTVIDWYTNILNVRLFAAHRYMKVELNRSLHDAMQSDKNLRWHLLKLVSIQGLISVGMIGSCLFVLVLFPPPNITIGDFALVLTFTLSFSDIIWHFTQEISRFSESYGLVKQGLVLLNQESEIYDVIDAKELCVTKGEICFKKVYFQYPNSDPLFKNTSITLYAGQKIGLVGYSGSGKSTFLNLMLRVFDVDEGGIFIDGQDITQVTRDSLYRAITMIAQDPTLFHWTLMENIRYGRLDASDEEVVAAAKEAYAHDFITNFSHGYNTVVGERGVKLSGGQRQRIAIARAILKNSAILLLDEATSALDSVTEALINNSIYKIMQNKTAIIIAHRFSTLLHVDRILVFDQGKIMEDGTHSDLMTRGGIYKTLLEKQIGNFTRVPTKQNNKAEVFDFLQK